MSIYQWLCFLGLDVVFAAIIGWGLGQIKKDRAERKSVKSGLQALLRRSMIEDYNKWSERGYAPIYVKDSFENCWKQYHGLGVNGVMDALHDEFMELPTEPPKK